MSNKKLYIKELQNRSKNYKDVLYIIINVEERKRIQTVINHFDNFIDQVKLIDDNSFNNLLPYDLSKAFNRDYV